MIFFSLVIQRRLVKGKEYYKPCYSLWKETSRNTLKIAAAKKSFPSVYIIVTTYFNECFLLHVITGRHYFSYKCIYTHKLGETAMLLCSWKEWFQKSPRFVSLISTITLQCCYSQGPKTTFLLLKFVVSVFSFFQFVNVLHFPS